MKEDKKVRRTEKEKKILSPPWTNEGTKSNGVVQKVQTARRMLHQIERSNDRRIQQKDTDAAEPTIRESEKSETVLLHYTVDADI